MRSARQLGADPGVFVRVQGWYAAEDECGGGGIIRTMGAKVQRANR